MMNKEDIGDEAEFRYEDKDTSIDEAQRLAFIEGAIWMQDKVNNVGLYDVMKCECKKPDPVNFTHLKYLYCGKCEGRLSFL
jgi:hypothetical protein